MERAALFQGARAVWNAFFGIGRRWNKTLRQRCRLPKPGRRLWACVCAGASAGRPRKLTRSRRTLKNATRRIHPSSSVTCLPRALEALNEGDPVKALEMTQPPLRTTSPSRTAYLTGAFLRSPLSRLRAGLAYSHLGRPSEARLSFKQFSIIRASY